MDLKTQICTFLPTINACTFMFNAKWPLNTLYTYTYIQPQAQVNGCFCFIRALTAEQQLPGRLCYQENVALQGRKIKI